MGYDMHFDCGPIKTREQLGSFIVIGGTTEPFIAITYNYSQYYYEIWPEKGIRTLYGKTAQEIVTMLEEPIRRLGTSRDPDYWRKTPGNAGAALHDLRELATLCPPDAILDGD